MGPNLSPPKAKYGPISRLPGQNSKIAFCVWAVWWGGMVGGGARDFRGCTPSISINSVLHTQFHTGADTAESYSDLEKKAIGTAGGCVTLALFPMAIPWRCHGENPVMTIPKIP